MAAAVNGAAEEAAAPTLMDVEVAAAVPAAPEQPTAAAEQPAAAAAQPQLGAAEQPAVVAGEPQPAAAAEVPAAAEPQPHPPSQLAPAASLPASEAAGLPSGMEPLGAPSEGPSSQEGPSEGEQGGDAKSGGEPMVMEAPSAAVAAKMRRLEAGALAQQGVDGWGAKLSGWAGGACCCPLLPKWRVLELALAHITSC